MRFADIAAFCLGLSAMLLALSAHGFSTEPVVVLDNGTVSVRKISQELSARKIAHELAGAATARSARTNSRAVWVAVSAGQFRAEDAAAVVAHLKAGGGLLVMGEMPFEKLLYAHGDRRLMESVYLERILEPKPVVSFSNTAPSDFTRSTNTPEVESRLVIESEKIPTATGVEERRVAHVVVPKLAGWTTFAIPLPQEKPADSATCFWARGTSETRQLALEWTEKDGSRWIAKINLTQEWQFFVLKPEDFRFFYDSPAKTRGQKGDRLRMENAARFSVGLAFTHTALGPGPHEFWIGDVGLGDIKAGQMEGIVRPPPVDGIFPGWMGYPVRPGSLRVSESFRSPTSEALPVPSSAWSAYWRPMGSGFDKDRRLRFIPVVTALNPDGSRAGTLAHITLQFRGQYSGAVYGAIGITNQAVLFSKPWLDLAAEMIRRMQHRSFFHEAGTSEFTYDIRDLNRSAFKTGCRTVEMDPGEESTAKLRVSDGGEIIWSGERTGHDKIECSADIPFSGKQVQTLQYRAELYRGGKLVDVIEQEIGFDGPRLAPVFITARDNRFFLGDRPFRAFGVNYMPSSGCASTDRREFEMFLEDGLYDPEIAEADLSRIAKLGMNSISIFIYSGSVERANLLDILRRARNHGLLVNLALRPAVDAPLAPRRDVFEAIIPRFRLAEKAEIMAYDIAWEPWWGHQRARARFGPRWREWVLKKYGSSEAAERAWHYAPANLEAFPMDEQLDNEGPWLAAVNDYRAFVDETLNASYGTAREQVRELDPNHLVSFRQSEGANPFAGPGQYPMDLASVSEALDFFSPEGYGIGDSADKCRTMVFAAAYAQGLAPGKPVIWSEYGMSVWNGSAFTPNTARLEKQAEVFRNVLEGAQQARSAGTFAWWLPGGYRSDEDSDYGIINPDGTDRPVTALIREYAATAVSEPPPFTWGPDIVAKRTDSVRGYPGVYERAREQFYRQLTRTNVPVIISR